MGACAERSEFPIAVMMFQKQAGAEHIDRMQELDNERNGRVI